MKLKQVSRFSAVIAVSFGVSGMSVGCLEDDEGPSGSVGGSSMGGSGAGMAGSGNGGTSGGAQGGSSGAGMGGGGANMDPTVMLQPGQCGGIGSDDPCPLIGTCADRPCGIADFGTRNCVCQPQMAGATPTWDCESCSFDQANLPAVLRPPGTGDADAGDGGDAGGGSPPLEACEASVADNVQCTEGARCKKGTGDAAELCVCLLREDDGMGPFIWDCDDPPNFWPAGSF